MGTGLPARPAAGATTAPGPDPSKGPVKVRLSPQYVAATKGFFKEFGLGVEINTAWGSDKGAAAVLILVLISAVLYLLVSAGESYVLRWRG